MKVLVLLSTYCGDKYLKEQIDSIIHQVGLDVGLLIRDDGSKDGTVELLKEYQRNNKNIEVEYGDNIGCADSFKWLLNAAFERIQDFEYFAFSDQDDVWLPEKLLEASKYLQIMDAQKPCMYCSNVHAVDEQLNDIGLKWKAEETFITKPQSLVSNMAHGCTMLFNQSVVRHFHQNTPKSIILHDLWVMHICMFFGDIYYDSNSYILYRQHGDNVVGAKNTFKARFESHKKSFQHLSSQHEKETDAKEILSVYGNQLSDDDKRMVEVVAFYRHNYSARLRWLFGIGEPYKSIRRKKDNIWLYIRIVLGKV